MQRQHECHGGRREEERQTDIRRRPEGVQVVAEDVLRDRL